MSREGAPEQESIPVVCETVVLIRHIPATVASWVTHSSQSYIASVVEYQRRELVS